MPQTRLARNQRLRRNQLTELVCEVTSLSHEIGAMVQFKDFIETIRSHAVRKIIFLQRHAQTAWHATAMFHRLGGFVK
jgi:hypothetical protein